MNNFSQFRIIIMNFIFFNYNVKILSIKDNIYKILNPRDIFIDRALEYSNKSRRI